MTVFLSQNEHKMYEAAQRLKLLLCGPSHDVHAADIFYHKLCYNCFLRYPRTANDSFDFETENLIMSGF